MKKSPNCIIIFHWPSSSFVRLRWNSLYKQISLVEKKESLCNSGLLSNCLREWQIMFANNICGVTSGNRHSRRLPLQRRSYLNKLCRCWAKLWPGCSQLSSTTLTALTDEIAQLVNFKVWPCTVYRLHQSVAHPSAGHVTLFENSVALCSCKKPSKSM